MKDLSLSELVNFTNMLDSAVIKHTVEYDEEEDLTFVKVADFQDRLFATFTFDGEGDLDNIMQWDDERGRHVAR